MRWKPWGTGVLLGGLVLITSFQNCGPQGQTCRSGDKLTCETTSSSTGTSNPNGYGGYGSINPTSTTGSGSTAGTTTWSSGGTSSGYGGTTGGTGTGSGGTGTTGDGGYGGGTGGTGTGGTGTGGTGTGGTGTGGTGGGGGGPFAIVTDLASSIEVFEGESPTLQITVQGGTGPMQYRWFKNNAEIPGMSLRSSSLSLASSKWLNYDIEGSYFVKVIDESNGAFKISKSINVSVKQEQDVCRDQKYGMEYNALLGSFAQDTFYNGFGSNGADGRRNVRGWYFRYTSSDSSSTRSTFQLPLSPYLTQKTVACTDPLFRILYPSGYAAKPSNQYDYTPTIQGDIKLECRQDKWLVIEGNCSWTTPPSTTPTNNFE